MKNKYVLLKKNPSNMVMRGSLRKFTDLSKVVEENLRSFQGKDIIAQVFDIKPKVNKTTMKVSLQEVPKVEGDGSYYVILTGIKWTKGSDYPVPNYTYPVYKIHKSNILDESLLSYNFEEDWENRRRFYAKKINVKKTS